MLGRAETIISTKALQFADAVQLQGRRTIADTVVAEVIPLLGAIRFLRREAAAILKPRKVGLRGRPLWLTGVTSLVVRDSVGIVLVIAPFNYPLFLPGVQALQALAAGNAVAIKPSPGHSAPMHLLQDCLRDAGLPDGLFVILDETVEAAQAAIAAGVDLIVFTGSGATGKAVLRQAAEMLTPVILELSGSDAVFVLEGADLNVVTRALSYGLTLNGGATCIAPRRVFVPQGLLPELKQRLATALANKPFYTVSPAALDHAVALLQEAKSEGAEIIGGYSTGETMTAAIVVCPPASSGLLHEDLFAPILSLIPVASSEQALELAAQSRFALGASVFGPKDAAENFAMNVDAGVVTVNDLIAPSADPRLPFEGRRGSGYGATRGPEGLLAMTRSRAVAMRRNRFYFHFRPLLPQDAELFAAYAALAHKGTGIGAGLLHLLKQIAAFRRRIVTAVQRR